MTQASTAESLLSRDEMDALLEELATAQREQADRRRIFGGPRAGDGHAALQRVLEDFAEGYSKRLSMAYQRRVDWLLRGITTVEPGEVVETAAPGELFWMFESLSSASAWMSWSRSLVFAWLQIAFGAPEPRGVAPARPYTAIERSFLARLARETVSALAEPLATQGFEPGEEGELRGARDLLALEGTPFVQAQFEVRGFGDFGQLRLALPVGAMAARPGAPGSNHGVVSRTHHRAVFEAPVAVHAELGSTEISVESLASLRAGDVLPLRSASDGLLLLKVGDAPKFRALRGAIGERLAVQVTERIGESR